VDWGSSGPLSLSGSLPHISLRSAREEKVSLGLASSHRAFLEAACALLSLPLEETGEARGAESRVVVSMRGGEGRGGDDAMTHVARGSTPCTPVRALAALSPFFPPSLPSLFPSLSARD